MSDTSQVNTTVGATFETTIEQARRQVSICNACRYCEGFCSVFPSIQRLRHFSDGDVMQLSNLCHNCRACHYSCQYTAPHEFAINIPQALANVRVQSWHKFSYPRFLSTAFQHFGVLIALLFVLFFTLLIYVINSTQTNATDGFYGFMSHNLMVLIFSPAFVLPLLLIALALRRYWHETNGKRISRSHLSGALKQATTLGNLGGGQGQGCNFEKMDHYTNTRRYLHQATVLGFLLCFASTSTGTLMHYLLDMQAPYAWYSLPKLLGVPGGILLTIGCSGLAYIKCHADQSLGADNAWGAEMAFVVLLGLTGCTGLMLYAATGTSYVGFLLAVHLACVLTLFILLPYSKMVHGFFRMAALIRDEQIKQNP